jgi:hypothetical protein
VKGRYGNTGGVMYRDEEICGYRGECAAGRLRPLSKKAHVTRLIEVGPSN